MPDEAEEVVGEVGRARMSRHTDKRLEYAWLRPLVHGARLENDAFVFVPGVQIGPRPPQFTPSVLQLPKALHWRLGAHFSSKDSARSARLNGRDRKRLRTIGPSDTGCRRAPELVLSATGARVAQGAD